MQYEIDSFFGNEASAHSTFVSLLFPILWCYRVVIIIGDIMSDFSFSSDSSVVEINSSCSSLEYACENSVIDLDEKSFNVSNFLSENHLCESTQENRTRRGQRKSYSEYN